MHHNPDPKAQKRMSVILQVLNGQITATQGAEQLGVSRKTFHSWENKALLSLHESLKDKSPGRPERELNPYVEEIENKLKNLSKQVLMLEQEREIRDILQGKLTDAFDELDGIPSGTQKKSSESKPSKSKKRQKKKKR